MNRRQFFTVTSCIVAAGCGRSGTRVAVLSPEEQAGIDRSRQERDEHLALIKSFRVQSGVTRTTPKPPVDVPTIVPELKGLSKVTIRLHPRYGNEPRPDESKVGGQFLWPADEPWPTDPMGMPLVPVLQLREEDAPPNFTFRPGTDLLQLLWSPRPELKPVVAWRKRSAVTGDLAPYPDTMRSNLDFEPVPCRVFPERVTEYPPYEILPATVKANIDGSKGLSRELYDTRLGVAAGTKVGGYPMWRQTADSPACPSCGWGMDFLLSVAGREWDDGGKSRWKPLEEVAVTDDVGYRSAAGLNLGNGGGTVMIFVCRRCEHWPIRMKLG